MGLVLFVGHKAEVERGKDTGEILGSGGGEEKLK